MPPPMAELDGVRVIWLPPGKAPPGRLKEAIGLMAGRAMELVDMVKRSAEVVPGGRVLPPAPTAPKEPIAKAPGGFLFDPCRGPMLEDCLVEADLAEPPSPSPIRFLTCSANSKDGFSTNTFWNCNKNSLSYLKLWPLAATAEFSAGFGELMFGG